MGNIQFDIVEFEDEHKGAVEVLMHSIASEFNQPIRPPKANAPTGNPQLPDKYWVAIVDGKVVGTISLYKLNNRASALKRMFLHKDFRGVGIADALLDRFMKKVMDDNISEIYLGTMDQFITAQKFYERHGFVKISIGELPQDFPLNPVDTLFYKKSQSK